MALQRLAKARGYIVSIGGGEGSRPDGHIVLSKELDYGQVQPCIPIDVPDGEVRADWEVAPVTVLHDQPIHLDVDDIELDAHINHAADLLDAHYTDAS